MGCAYGGSQRSVRPKEFRRSKRCCPTSLPSPSTIVGISILRMCPGTAWTPRQFFWHFFPEPGVPHSQWHLFLTPGCTRSYALVCPPIPPTRRMFRPDVRPAEKYKAADGATEKRPRGWVSYFPHLKFHTQDSSYYNRGALQAKLQIVEKK